MASDVLFIQGAGPDVHERWDRALADSLGRALDVPVRYPRMPDEADPHFAVWRPAIARELDALGDGAILVGHSLGGTMLVHALAERAGACTASALVLISAPFIGEGAWPSDELPARTDFGLPPALRVLLFHGAADTTVPTAHVHRYARAIPQATVHVLVDRDHQLNGDLTEVARELRARSGASARTP